MGWLASLGSKVNAGVNWLGSKAKQVSGVIGGKMTSIGNIVSNVASKVAPLLAGINPELGMAAATVGTFARSAATGGKLLTSFVWFLVNNLFFSILLL